MSDKHPNIQKVEQLFAAHAAGDFERFHQLLSPGVEWFTPGHHPLAGVKRGAHEIFAFFDQLPKAKFRAEPLCLAADGPYVVDCHRGWSEEGPGLDNIWCLLYVFDNGKIQKVTNLTSDQHRADLFFNRIYELKPIPARLVDEHPFSAGSPPRGCGGKQ